MRLIFVRHGQTVFNHESRYQGHTDVELSDLGRRQALRVADRLRDEEIDAIYSSDLSRARVTAEEIAKFHNLPVNTDADLRECAFGDWEGLTTAEISARFPEDYAAYQRDSVANRASGGERLESVQTRVVQAIERIENRHPNATVAVVIHGGPIRGFVCHALGASLRAYRKMNIGNCGITIFSRDPDGKWLLEILNDLCHLEGVEITEEDESAGK